MSQGVRYQGRRLRQGEVKVEVVTGNQRRTLEHRVRHSPTGVEWGYGGSGPADLARSILWDHLGMEPSPDLYQAFKSAFVATWHTDSWSLHAGVIDRWLAARARADAGS